MTFLFSLLFSVSAVFAQGTECAGTGPATEGYSQRELALAQLINDYRKSKGKTPVKLCASMSVAAQRHVNDLRDRNYFSHKGKDGSEFWERTCDTGYVFGCGPQTWMGEILAAGSTDPLGTIQQWINSPGHESIMRDGAYVVMGVGHACGGGQWGNYWLANFAGRDHASCDSFPSEEEEPAPVPVHEYQINLNLVGRNISPDGYRVKDRIDIIAEVLEDGHPKNGVTVWFEITHNDKYRYKKKLTRNYVKKGYTGASIMQRQLKLGNYLFKVSIWDGNKLLAVTEKSITVK